MRTRLTAAALPLLAAAAGAQQPAFRTPGMPSSAAPPAPPQLDTGQADRFSSVFNPAFSFVVDAVADYLDTEDGADDGIGLEMRTLEFGAQSWVDPNAWAYFIAATDGETLNVEEAAVHYVGLGSNTTIRAGRFFVDFGKQMQTHVHELRTLERPLVLRTFLGDEVKGDGLQYDGWTGIGDATALRWSLGVFANLLPESELEPGVPELSVADRKDAQDLDFTARVTGFTDVGENGVGQLGASGRFIPDYTASLDGSEADGLSSSVLGLDATYGWTSDDALSTWTVGGEFLFNLGDTIAQIDDGGTPDPGDDVLTGYSTGTQDGWYVFVDHGWDLKHSIGAQYSQTQLPQDGEPTAREAELYYTRNFSEFHRLRLVASAYDTDEPDGDSLRFAIQYTATLGAHGHGVNW